LVGGEGGVCPVWPQPGPRSLEAVVGLAKKGRPPEGHGREPCSQTYCALVAGLAASPYPCPPPAPDGTACGRRRLGGWRRGNPPGRPPASAPRSECRSQAAPLPPPRPPLRCVEGSVGGGQALDSWATRYWLIAVNLETTQGDKCKRLLSGEVNLHLGT